MSQTTYNVEPPLSFAGLIAEYGGDENSMSRAFENSDADAGYGAGRPAVEGTDPATQFDKPTAGGDVFVGITVHQHGREDLGLAGDFAFVQDENVKILRRGRIWVVVEEAVVAGDPVAYRVTDNGGLLQGGWRNDVAAGEAVLVAQAVFLTGAALGGLAMVDVNLP